MIFVRKDSQRDTGKNTSVQNDDFHLINFFFFSYARHLSKYHNDNSMLVKQECEYKMILRPEYQNIIAENENEEDEDDFLEERQQTINTTETDMDTNDELLISVDNDELLNIITSSDILI